MRPVRIHRSELPRWDRYLVDPGVWMLRDGAVGQAWLVDPDAERLHALADNYFYHPHFAGSYLQLLWTPAGVLVTVKAFLPVRAPGLRDVLRGMGEHESAYLDTRAHLQDRGVRLFVEQSDRLAIVLGKVGLDARPVVTATPLERAFELVFDHYQGRDRLEGSLAGMALEDGTIEPVVSFELMREVEIEAARPFFTGPRSGEAVYHVTLSQERAVNGASGLGLLHAYGFVTWESLWSLEAAWAESGIYVGREGPLALPIAVWSIPFGAMPALEHVLDGRAVRVTVPP